MKKVPMHEHAFATPRPSGIGAKNTVSSGPDDGTNNLLASHFWNVMRHGSTRQAAGNALSAILAVANISSTGELNIGGHGNEGQLETGMGQTGPFSNETIILTWNEPNWAPPLEQLRTSPITQISIWSCHTGAGQDGADLLFAMAKRCGRAVRAGTGFLYSNAKETWWENGSVWQVATPTNKPSPISAPSTHSIMTESLTFQVGSEELDVTSIKEIRIELLQFGRPLAGAKTITTHDAQMVVAGLFKAPALELDAHVAGFKTASIILDFGQGRTLDFDVYNNRLAVDPRSKIGYYIACNLQSVYSSAP